MKAASSGIGSRIADTIAASSGIRSQIADTIAAGVTEPPAPRSPRLRRRRVDLVFVADVITAFILFLITSNVLGHTGLHGATPGPIRTLLLPLFLCGPLVLRTRYPLTSFSICVLAVFWAGRVVAPMSAAARGYIPALIVYGLCLYAVAVRCKTWVVITAAAVTVFGAYFIEGQSLTGVLFAVAVPVATEFTEIPVIQPAPERINVLEPAALPTRCVCVPPGFGFGAIHTGTAAWLTCVEPGLNEP